MRQPILSPDRFAAEFNVVVPGAYREITVQDIKDMTDCGLICKYRYYCSADLETVRAILLYEQMREERSRTAALVDNPRTCKRCGHLLPSQSDGRRGRPGEYCPDCEPFRGMERYRKWRNRQVGILTVH